MNEIVFSVEQAPEGGFIARALGHSIFTEGETEQELREMVRDAVRCHFDEDDRPAVIRLHFVRDEVLAPFKQTAITNGNIFEALMDAVRVCSLGQITHALFEVGGQYRRSM